MKRRRHTPEQIVRKLREADRLLAEGREVPEVAKALEVSEATYHRWRAQYGGLKADDVRRLKELEVENARLKRIVADRSCGSRRSRSWGGETGEPAPAGAAPSSTCSRCSASPSGGRASWSGSTAPPNATSPWSRIAPGRCVNNSASSAGPTRAGATGAHAQLRAAGWTVNRKAVQRLWREEGLRVPPRRHKRQRLGSSTMPAARLAAEHPDHVWALDYQFDQTEDGRILKQLNVVDEHTREALAITVERRLDADATVAVLDRLVAGRQTVPRFIRCDNGPELTANALRDWCRFNRAGISYTEPGSPWQNPYAESFGGRLRDELLAGEAFSALLEARVLVEDWRIEYNTVRPHSALGYRTQPSTPEPGPPTNPHSHSGLANDRGPVRVARLLRG
jgi:putative transposase